MKRTTRFASWLFGIGLVGFGLVLLVACAGRSGRTIPDAATLADYTGANVDELSRGRTAYVRNCSECHHYYYPSQRTVEEWDRIAPVMGKRAGLDAAGIDDLLAFLRAAAVYPAGD
jgi:hypothetical protein